MTFCLPPFLTEHFICGRHTQDIPLRNASRLRGIGAAVLEEMLTNFQKPPKT